MILVTVGTHNQGFDRLAKAADELVNELKEQIIIQYGTSGYSPKYAESFQWTTQEHMLELIADARVVITHAAAGSIIEVLKAGKPLVVVPRLRQYNEHFDDHQLQLARALQAEGRAVLIQNITVDALRDSIFAVTQLATVNSDTTVEKPHKLVAALRQQLSNWAEQDSSIHPDREVQ